ncbi:MAG: hypothetical protein DRR06_13465 [Gammaproteobacteria bacterium]|nr:MAG: hypothetical protein DRR06_13465 [Gammaproteobacteria bacterium]
MSKPSVGDVYYRYENDNLINFFDGIKKGLPIKPDEFLVESVTNAGCWVHHRLYTERKFILDGARKRYAYPTKKLAWDSFKRRRYMQADILDRQLRRLNQILYYVKEIDAKGGVDM